MKNESGVTLLALVITIIVLLILSAIAITALSGENGLLRRAEAAAAATAEAELEEMARLLRTEYEIEKRLENMTIEDFMISKGFTEAAGVWTNGEGQKFTIGAGDIITPVK